MAEYSDELRLAWIVLLNAMVLAAAYRFACRRGQGGILQAVCDALLHWFVVQYLAVGIPGIFGILNATTMSLTAAVLSAALWLAAGRKRVRDAIVWDADYLILVGCAFFVVAYLLGHAWVMRPVPPLATDALVYHLPTAVQWLQAHRLGIYPTWYWNPAASYSPASGSMFMYWWMAPAGNDVFVRYVQLPALLLIFFVVVRMGRLMGCSRAVAGLIAVAATLSRPLFSETVVAKDDLYVTAFVVVAVLSLAREPMCRPLVAWRAGIALGMVLASKYTMLLACPIFLFVADSPFLMHWRRRQWLIAIGAIVLLALPWYLRNILLTGNPLFPVDVHLPGMTLRGLFGTERDQQLRSASGVWHMLADTYHSLPAPLIVALVIGWGTTLVVAGRSVLRDPLPRTCILGSVLTAVLFLIVSPHHEVRYLFPLLVLIVAGIGLGCTLVCPTIECFPIVLAACFAILAVGTTFEFSLIGSILTHAGFALLIAAIAIGVILLQTRMLHLKRDRIVLLASLGAGGLALLAYAQWHAYVSDYRRDLMTAWEAAYPRHAPLWKWVDENVPADATVAYGNTFFIYPYYGFDLTRRVVYAPVRHGLHDFRGLPRLGDRVPGDLIVRKMTETMDADPDRATWYENLAVSRAQFLIVMKPGPEDPDVDPHPPELGFAGSSPQRFERIYEDETGVVFRIK